MFCTKCGKELPENGVCSCQQVPEQQQPPANGPAGWQDPGQQAQSTPPEQPYAAPGQQSQQNTPPQWQPGQQPYQQPYGNQFQAPPSDNRKVFSILSYISILWLIGLLVSPEKNDPRVKFHVGQGIILSIVSVGLSIVVSIISAIFNAVFRTQITYFGIRTYTISPAAAIISGLLWLASSGVIIALAIVGIVNVCKNQDKPLPVIGSFAFYK